MPRQTRRELRKDNSSMPYKLKQRRQVIQALAERGEAPCVLEAYGGYGILYSRCYAGVPNARGVVIEKVIEKCQHLSRQRDSENWSVIKAKSEVIVANGLATWMPFNLIDVDAWGVPWDVIFAYFSTEVSGARAHGKWLYIVTTDGTPYASQVRTRVKSLIPYIQRYGEVSVREHYDTLAVEMCQDASGGEKGPWRLRTFDFEREARLAHWTAGFEWVGTNAPAEPAPLVSP